LPLSSSYIPRSIYQIASPAGNTNLK